MPIKFYNTLTREKEEFFAMDPNKVKMYSCGPTVYNYPHIGNYRAYIFADILKRVLVYEGYHVKHIMNLTDIDDKTIRGSQKDGKTLKEFTEFYTQEFLKDIKSLNIVFPATFTKATDYIPQMVEIIEKLFHNGLAYKSDDGSFYFDIKKFEGYGKLSRLVLENQRENAQGRIKSDEYEKENAQDFALWKAWDAKDGEVFWDTKLGKGRPGWHIECSAMSMANLGEQLDIHTGGVDNIFPHHENEIAQSEGSTGVKFVNYWLHNEWVLVDHKKMAKSEQNFFTLADLKSKNIDPIAYRFWLLMANYRTRVNFVWEALEASETALKRLYRLYVKLASHIGDEKGQIDLVYQEKFRAFIADDLDTPRALSLLWDLIKDGEVSNADKKATILEFDKVFGLDFEHAQEKIEKYTDIELPDEVVVLMLQRDEARKNKDFELSDKLRQEINTLGYDVKDEADGQKASKI
ncbi:MAG: cysteine--tRNA ligase [bacterium]|nr:cysteine--tRNA ligase [bacterium]